MDLLDNLSDELFPSIYSLLYRERPAAIILRNIMWAHLQRRTCEARTGPNTTHISRFRCASTLENYTKTHVAGVQRCNMIRNLLQDLKITEPLVESTTEEPGLF